MDDFIGTRSEQGAVYPRLTIHGNPNYDRTNATTVDIGGGHFVVIGLGEPIDIAKIEALKQALSTPTMGVTFTSGLLKHAAGGLQSTEAAEESTDDEDEATRDA